jgi:hypothetical protein
MVLEPSEREFHGVASSAVDVGCNKAIAALHRCLLQSARIGAIRANALLHPTIVLSPTARRPATAYRAR